MVKKRKRKRPAFEIITVKKGKMSSAHVEQCQDFFAFPFSEEHLFFFVPYLFSLFLVNKVFFSGACPYELCWMEHEKAWREGPIMVPGVLLTRGD